MVENIWLKKSQIIFVTRQIIVFWSMFPEDIGWSTFPSDCFVSLFLLPTAPRHEPAIFVWTEFHAATLEATASTTHTTSTTAALTTIVEQFLFTKEIYMLTVVFLLVSMYHWWEKHCTTIMRQKVAMVILMNVVSNFGDLESTKGFTVPVPSLISQIFKSGGAY